MNSVIRMRDKDIKKKKREVSQPPREQKANQTNNVRVNKEQREGMIHRKNDIQ